LYAIFYILKKGKTAMTLQDIMDKCQSIPLAIEVENNEAYVEVFLAKDDTAKIAQILEECLGEPIKPAGHEPCEEDRVLTVKYGGIKGGILREQTLYKKVFEGYTLVAMIWPWHREEKTTCKMFVTD